MHDRNIYRVESRVKGKNKQGMLRLPERRENGGSSAGTRAEGRRRMSRASSIADRSHDCGGKKLGRNR